jgi:hypothetical protein
VNNPPPTSSASEREEAAYALHEELLLGGVILSEWSVFLARDAEIAYVNGAFLSSLLASMAGIECHLRFEQGPQPSRPRSLYDLVEISALPTDLRAELHRLRRYRNRWVHVNEPENDMELIAAPVKAEAEIEVMARDAFTALLRVLYLDQWV